MIFDRCTDGASIEQAAGGPRADRRLISYRLADVRLVHLPITAVQMFGAQWVLPTAVKMTVMLALERRRSVPGIANMIEKRVTALQAVADRRADFRLQLENDRRVDDISFKREAYVFDRVLDAK